MFIPKYTITDNILNRVGSIDGCLEIANYCLLSNLWLARLQREALEKTIFHTAHIEGNQIAFEDIKAILDGKEVEASGVDVKEIINLQLTHKFLDEIVAKVGVSKDYYFTIETILEMHRLLFNEILDPSIAGQWRSKQVAIKNIQTGEISFTPPPAAEIPYLIEDLFNWVNSDRAKQLHPVVKSGIIHFEVSRIHPFTRGTGKIARAITLLLLNLDGYDFKKGLCLEESYDESPMEYYLTIQAVANSPVLDAQERDLTPWLDFFVNGFASQASVTKEKIKRLSTDSKVKDKLGEKIELNERQVVIMEYLHRHKLMYNKDFRKIFPDFSDDTVLRELRFLRKKGLIKKEGGTKKAAYVLG